MPAGGFPEARPPPTECSLTLPGGEERREPRGGGTVSIVPEDAWLFSGGEYEYPGDNERYEGGRGLSVSGKVAELQGDD